MFTTGQWIFALLFFVGFVALTFWSYKKDKGLHKKHYKGSFWILLGFLTFILILFGIKMILKD